MRRLSCAVALLFVLGVVAGCASAGVSKRDAYAGEKLPRPDRIIVHDFTVDPSEVPPGSTFAQYTADAATPTAEQLAVTRKMGAAVAEKIVARLREAGLPAVQAAGQPAPAVNDIVIRGYFVSVDEGSAVERVVVGFGEGDAKLMTAVEGYQMTPDGLRLLGSGEVDSGDNSMPGVVVPVAVLAVTANPIGLIVGGALKASGELDGSETIDGAAERTADEIAAQLKEAAQKQGWI